MCVELRQNILIPGWKYQQWRLTSVGFYYFGNYFALPKHLVRCFFLLLFLYFVLRVNVNYDWVIHNTVHRCLWYRPKIISMVETKEADLGSSWVCLRYFKKSPLKTFLLCGHSAFVWIFYCIVLQSTKKNLGAWNTPGLFNRVQHRPSYIYIWYNNWDHLRNIIYDIKDFDEIMNIQVGNFLNNIIYLAFVFQ